MNDNDKKLDDYIKNANQAAKKKSVLQNAEKQRRKSTPSSLKRWAASAAMDLFRIYIPLLLIVLSGGLCLIIEPSIAKYIFYVAAMAFLPALAYCVVDYIQFQSWIAKLPYRFEGWNSVIHSRSTKFWDMNGEYWISTRITIMMKGEASEKHVQAAEAFIKKIRKRFNQWTVSGEARPGYSQPTGWTCDGLTLTGNMNPRVLNLVRKKFSGEFSQLTRLMPGRIDKVLMSVSGKEEYHEVSVDSD